jgi:triacylglycerol esterase/lipase EstA (alpha/beta hydrolase family)
MSDNCTKSDWTDGRFSQKIIDNITQAVKTIAQNKPIILIGYSGGALLSGLIINQNLDINVIQWITIAGVLNHTDWTSYFGDKPLTKSAELNTLPQLPQTHYIAEHDNVVPNELSQKWTKNKNLITVPNATHGRLSKIKLQFNH